VVRHEPVTAERSLGRGLLDTSVVLLLEVLTDEAVLPDEPMISAVTLAELAVGPLVAGTETKRVLRQTQLQQAEANFVALPFDVSAARAFGRVVAELRAAGVASPRLGASTR